MTLAVRLNARLTRAANGCLEWTGAVNRGGYGVIRADGRALMLRAHRVAWALAHPGEPMPAVVRHTCDNPPCCNPAHLLAGTHADNSADRVARNPKAAGEKHPRAKITDAQVEELRAAYAAGGISQRALGHRFGISGAHVNDLIHRNYRRL